jgi:hypothetical protein
MNEIDASVNRTLDQSRRAAHSSTLLDRALSTHAPAIARDAAALNGLMSTLRQDLVALESRLFRMLLARAERDAARAEAADRASADEYAAGKATLLVRARADAAAARMLLEIEDAATSGAGAVDAGGSGGAVRAMAASINNRMRATITRSGAAARSLSENFGGTLVSLRAGVTSMVNDSLAQQSRSTAAAAERQSAAPAPAPALAPASSRPAAISAGPNASGGGGGASADATSPVTSPSRQAELSQKYKDAVPRTASTAAAPKPPAAAAPVSPSTSAATSTPPPSGALSPAAFAADAPAPAVDPYKSFVSVKELAKAREAEKLAEQARLAAAASAATPTAVDAAATEASAAPSTAPAAAAPPAKKAASGRVAALIAAQDKAKAAKSRGAPAPASAGADATPPAAAGADATAPAAAP